MTNDWTNHLNGKAIQYPLDIYEPGRYQVRVTPTGLQVWKSVTGEAPGTYTPLVLDVRLDDQPNTPTGE